MADRVLREHPELRCVSRLTLLQSFQCVRLALWDESRRRLVSRFLRCSDGTKCPLARSEATDPHYGDRTGAVHYRRSRTDLSHRTATMSIA
jgi:hypothetical protein